MKNQINQNEINQNEIKNSTWLKRNIGKIAGATLLVAGAYGGIKLSPTFANMISENTSSNSINKVVDNNVYALSKEEYDSLCMNQGCVADQLYSEMSSKLYTKESGLYFSYTDKETAEVMNYDRRILLDAFPMVCAIDQGQTIDPYIFDEFKNKYGIDLSTDQGSKLIAELIQQYFVNDMMVRNWYTGNQIKFEKLFPKSTDQLRKVYVVITNNQVELRQAAGFDIKSVYYNDTGYTDYKSVDNGKADISKATKCILKQITSANNEMNDGSLEEMIKVGAGNSSTIWIIQSSDALCKEYNYVTYYKDDEMTQNGEEPKIYDEGLMGPGYTVTYDSNGHVVSEEKNIYSEITIGNNTYNDIGPNNVCYDGNHGELGNYVIAPNLKGKIQYAAMEALAQIAVDQDQQNQKARTK